MENMKNNNIKNNKNMNESEINTNNESTTTAYKFLTSDPENQDPNSNLKSYNGNIKWIPREWNTHTKPLKLCESGFHACRTPLQALEYVYGDRFVIVEASGEIIDSDDKFICSRMRVIKELPTKEIMIRFVIACAKNCLFRFEKKYPDDDRPRKAIEAVEKYMRGEITVDELRKITDDTYAAADAAYTAYAVNAAADAAYTAYAVNATAYASTAAYAANAAAYASTATRAAAYAADAYAASTASNAATAAYESERKWQNKKLEQIIREYV